MKTTIMLLGLSFILISASCSKDEIIDDYSPDSLTDVVIDDNAWTISYFWDSDKDETTHFSGFEFTFHENGVLSASNGTVNYSGTWSTRTDDSRLKMDISFSSPEDFADLSDDWHVIEYTETLIKLEDVSGGDGSTDYLTFSKN